MKKLVLTTALCLAATGASGAENLAEMLSEGTLKGVFRTYYFDQNYDGATTDHEDFAIGGWLHYETGSFLGVKAGVELRTSQDLGTSSGTTTSGLLVQDGDGREGYSAPNVQLDKDKVGANEVQF